MKRIRISSFMLLALFASSTMFTTNSVARADDVDLHRLLHGPERCDHVIGLLLRHGVNNDSPAPATTHTFHPYGPITIPATDIGDLELISIAQHGETSAGCGPSFNLVIKNCSARDVCGSRVTLVGLLGRIRPTSPNVTVKIESLPAGQAVEVTLTLPIDALAMGNLNGQAIAMNRVLVVLDSYDQFMESNEANNLRMYETSAIPVVTAAAPPTPTDAVVSDAATSSPAATAPAATAVTQDQTEPASPSDSSVGLSSPDLKTAIDQFTDGATKEQDAS